MSRNSLSVVDPLSLADPDRSAAVHGVVLAAGTSSRYGEPNKLLESIDGCALVRHAVTTLLDARVGGPTVVVGHERDRVRAAVEGTAVDFRHNDQYERGQSTSVQVGVDAARDAGADAVVFALGDMPTVAPETVDALIQAYECDCATVLAAGYDGHRGNPVLFDAAHFDALESVTGDTGGRELFQSEADAAIVDTGDPGVHRDIDCPADLAHATRDT